LVITCQPSTLEGQSPLSCYKKEQRTLDRRNIFWGKQVEKLTWEHGTFLPQAAITAGYA